MAKPRALTTSAPRRKADELPAGYVADPSASNMLRFEASLPRLPVPPLSSTAAKYLESVQPHLTPKEFSDTQVAVQKFLESPLAKELQERLQARAAEPGRKSWLSDWWNDVAYMGYRDPVVVFVSYFYVHKDDPRKPGQAKRAADLLKAILSFRSLVERCAGPILAEFHCLTAVFPAANLSPRRFVACLFRWTRTSGCRFKQSTSTILSDVTLILSASFHACRYPVKPSDTAQKFDPAKHNHVVFVRKNKFFKVSLADAEGRELSAAELEVQIERIVSQAGHSKAVPVGALTSENRDIWTDVRRLASITELFLTRSNKL